MVCLLCRTLLLVLSLASSLASQCIYYVCYYYVCTVHSIMHCTVWCTVSGFVRIRTIYLLPHFTARFPHMYCVQSVVFRHLLDQMENIRTIWLSMYHNDHPWTLGRLLYCVHSVMIIALIHFALNLITRSHCSNAAHDHRCTLNHLPSRLFFENLRWCIHAP